MTETNSDIPFKYPRLDDCILNASLLDMYQKLLRVGDVKSENDAVSVLLHLFTMEIGFEPQNVDATSSSCKLPDDWKNVGVHYRFSYNHPTCLTIGCEVICIPIGDLLMVHGILQLDKGMTVCPPLEIKVNRYIQKQVNTLAFEPVFSNLDDLNWHYKDGIAYKLLAAAQCAAGVRPTFGFSALLPELKLEILSRLPIVDLLNMTEVNQECYDLANTPSLWQSLFQRHFPSATIPDEMEEPIDWKKMFKEVYLEQKEQQRAREVARANVRRIIFQETDHNQQHDIPPLPPGILGGEFDRLPNPRPRLPPEVLEAFPGFSRRLRSPHFSLDFPSWPM